MSMSVYAISVTNAVLAISQTTFIIRAMERHSKTIAGRFCPIYNLYHSIEKGEITDKWSLTNLSRFTTIALDLPPISRFDQAEAQKLVDCLPNLRRIYHLNLAIRDPETPSTWVYVASLVLVLAQTILCHTQKSSRLTHVASLTIGVAIPAIFYGTHYLALKSYLSYQKTLYKFVYSYPNIKSDNTEEFHRYDKKIITPKSESGIFDSSEISEIARHLVLQRNSIL